MQYSHSYISSLYCFFFNSFVPRIKYIVCQLLQGLETLVAQKKYQDWIFLFGTIIVAEGNLPANYDGGRWQAGQLQLNGQHATTAC